MTTCKEWKLNSFQCLLPTSVRLISHAPSLNRLSLPYKIRKFEHLKHFRRFFHRMSDAKNDVFRNCKVEENNQILYFYCFDWAILRSNSKKYDGWRCVSELLKQFVALSEILEMRKYLDFHEPRKKEDIKKKKKEEN